MIKPAKFVIDKRRRMFLVSKMKNRDMEESFKIIREMCKTENTLGYKFLERVMQYDSDTGTLQCTD